MQRETEKRPEPASETPKPKADDFVAPVEIPRETPQQVAQNSVPLESQFGSDTGDDTGVPEGMEGGVIGGTVGGTPGGVIGGVLGGTGDIPVANVDQQARLIRKVPPVYPQEAFVKKIEGTVLLEIYIDSTGKVARARVLQSIPSLDQAAIACVLQWVFAPAVKGGRPVLTTAHAPVTFRIY
jgi:protein TonB